MVRRTEFSKKLIIPNIPNYGNSGSKGIANNDTEVMPNIKRVIEYSGMTYREVLELPMTIFKLMLKNHRVDELNSTEEGRKYLETYHRLQVSEPDMEAVDSFNSH